MQTGIHVGATNIPKESADNLGNLISTVFNEGFKNHMEQSTIVEALNVIAKTLKVENVTITNSTIRGDTVINTQD